MKFKDTDYYKEIKDDFYYNEDGILTYDDNLRCSYMRLTSLEGCPEVLNGDFSCSSNNLTSLEGCPKVVNDRFWFANNKLTSLEFLPYLNNYAYKIDSDFSDEEILDYYKETYPEFYI